MTMSPKIKIVTGAILIIVILFLLLNFTSLSGKIRNVFYIFSSPIQKMFWGVGDNTSGFLESVFKKDELKEENDKLRKENQELLGELITLSEMETENNILRQALDVEFNKEFQFIFTEVIGKDIGEDFILIDKGSEDGVLAGMPVVTPQKIIYGRVDQVDKNFSKIMLITNKQSSFDVKIEGKNIFGLVKGKGNLNLSLERIPTDSEILEGEIIITSMAGGLFPEGLLVGRVKKIEKSDLEPFQKAEITRFFNIGEKGHLFIITDY